MRSKRFQGKLYLKTAEKIRNEISRKLLSKNASINGRFCKQAYETAFICLNLSSFPSFADGAWLQLGSQHRTWQTEIKTWGAPTVSRHFASCKRTYGCQRRRADTNFSSLLTPTNTSSTYLSAF